jgi:hypothetical protein
MKTSRRVGLVLGAIVIIGALIAAYVIYSGLARQRSDLNGKLETAQTFQSLLTNQKQDLQDQLASAQSSLAASQSQFPQSIQSIEYGEYLYEMAHECNVQMTSLTIPNPITRTVGDITYSVVSLNVPVSGAMDNIFTFIQTLRTDDNFASTEVRQINMNLVGGTVSVILSVDIYAHKG